MKVCSSCQSCCPDDVALCPQDGSAGFVSSGVVDSTTIADYGLMRRVRVHRDVESYEARENASGSACLMQVFSARTDTARILDEARTVKKVFDPAVIGVYDSGETEQGGAFVVSEIPEGQSLRQLLVDVGPPELLATIEIVRQIAEALQSLHSAGVIHGAVSPDNIFFGKGPNGRAFARLNNVDYGAVIEQSVTSNKFEIDSHIALLRYFAPEQCTGDERTPRSDVYSLGVVFYELLAGRPPFDSTKAAGLIAKHSQERPADIRINNFELRMLVTHALSESLQKQPDFRQSSANLLARQLRHIEQLATHKSTPPPAMKASRPIITTPLSSEPPRVEIYQRAEVERRQVVTPAKPKVKRTSKPVRKVKPVETMPMVPPQVEVTSVTELKSETSKVVATAVEVEQPPTTITETAPTAPKRSRLRSLKRKLNSLSAAVASAIERGSVTTLLNAAVEIADDAPKKAPRKIEWEQPEDDIPSIEDVAQVLATEGVGNALAADEQRPDAVEPTSKTVAETVTPAGDVVESIVLSELEPQVPDVVHTPAIDEVSEVAPEIIVTEKQSELPKTIEMSPESDPEIVEDESRSVLAQSSASEDKVSEADEKVAETVSAALPNAVTTGSWNVTINEAKQHAHLEAAASGSDEIPAAIADVPIPVLAHERQAVTPDPVLSATVEEPAKPIAVAVPRAKPIVVTIPKFADGDEEITLVRPPKRMRIDLEKPKTIYRARTVHARSIDDISYQPTMIGGGGMRVRSERRRSHVQDIPDGIFSAHFGSSTARSDRKYRAMVAGVGVVVLAVLFLFANDSVSKFFQNVSPGDSTTAQATSAGSSRETRVNPVTPAKSKPVATRVVAEAPRRSTVEKTRADISATADKSKPRSSPEKSKKELPAAVEKKTKPSASPIAKTQTASRRSEPSPKPAVGATRARVVANPRH